MNSATNTSGMEPDPWTDEEAMPDDLKVKVNAFLWTLLPPQMTLGEAEDVAVKIDSLIRDAWFKHQPASTAEERKGGERRG